MMSQPEYGLLSVANFRWWALLVVANDNTGGDNRRAKTRWVYK